MDSWQASKGKSSETPLKCQRALASLLSRVSGAKNRPKEKPGNHCNVISETSQCKLFCNCSGHGEAQGRGQERTVPRSIFIAVSADIYVAKIITWSTNYSACSGKQGASFQARAKSRTNQGFFKTGGMGMGVRGMLSSTTRKWDSASWRGWGEGSCGVLQLDCNLHLNLC